MTERASDIARDLLRIGAVALRPEDPFTWASGRLSPVYTDNRLMLSYPDTRDRVLNGLTDLLASMSTDVDAVSAAATAGIPMGTLLADRQRLPLSYVRSAAKAHGRQNQIEGRVQRGARVVIVEDLVSTGGSVLHVANVLRDAGAHVAGVLAVFTYGLNAAVAAFDEAGVPLHALVTLDDLAATAQASGALSRDELDTLSDWRRDPSAWSVERGGAA
ncbi:MAG: orotate phosphoribosyltransferase [Bacteroidota bacterium]